MKVLVTGSSNGIGRAIALKFIENNYEVIGFDLLEATIENSNYKHYKQNICDELPEIQNIDIVINNAGVQNNNDIDVNLKGTIKVTEKYITPNIKSVINKSMTGEDIFIDNGEKLKSNFIW